MSGEGAKPEAAVLPIRRASLSQKDVRQPVRHQVPATGNLSRPKVVPRPGSRVASIAKSFEQLSLAEGRTVTNRRSFRAASGIIRPSTVRRTHSVLTQQKPLTAVQVAVRNLEARCASPAKETPANHSFLWTRDNKELPYGGSLSSASGDASKRDDDELCEEVAQQSLYGVGQVTTKCVEHKHRSEPQPCFGSSTPHELYPVKH
ncbi:hypothetical protein HPB51_007433 [Rhipicephalus microplus]|uniref:Uncharacterized protein n=1 Tax=Rhipicephalus microplus TaxID=6941 RepID=A0A9J6EYP7_RHIMP|nr:hypothetical protein HPB51_007433 [Rhipicephalus microplus]